MTNELVHLAEQKQTYTNLLYLLVSLPLGILYFVVVVLGIASSIANIILLGIPLTVLFIVGWWRLAAFERKMVIDWLHIDIPAMSEPFKPNTNWLQRFQKHMSNPVTWKSLIYLFAKFPFGILAFCLILSILAVIVFLSATILIIGFLIAPFVYLVFAMTGKEIDGQALRRYTVLSLTGWGLALAPIYLLNVLALLWGQFARVMLGMSNNAVRLAEARAIAEQERARAALADQKRRDLIINVSHELRTPVASIRGHIESLLAACDESASGTPPPAALRNYLHIVHRESIRLGELVNDLLSVARTEADELRLYITEVDAGSIVEEVYQTLMPLARRERQITIVHNVRPGLPHVMADRQRLMQVLLNLVRNAITYTPDGGIVSIELQSGDTDYLVLSVSDTGVGIAPEDQQHIFERFYRTDASRARTSGGFGLGLAIVRDFVVAMGGSVSVESTVGEGSCFRVLLRVAKTYSRQPSLA